MRTLNMAILCSQGRAKAPLGGSGAAGLELPLVRGVAEAKLCPLAALADDQKTRGGAVSPPVVMGAYACDVVGLPEPIPLGADKEWVVGPDGHMVRRDPGPLCPPAGGIGPVVVCAQRFGIPS